MSTKMFKTSYLLYVSPCLYVEWKHQDKLLEVNLAINLILVLMLLCQSETLNLLLTGFNVGWKTRS